MKEAKERCKQLKVQKYQQNFFILTISISSIFTIFSFSFFLSIFSSQNLRVSSVKFMLDGVMETKTAHLQDPYLSTQLIRHPRGLALFTLDQMKEYFVLLDKEGFQYCIICDFVILLQIN
jgi:hypothetical protein